MSLSAALALPAVPALEGGAAGRCALALMAGLRAHGVDLRTVVGVSPHGPRVEPPPGLDLDLVPLTDDRSRWGSRVDRVRRPRGEMAQGEFLARVQQAARLAGLLHLEQVEASRLADGLRVPSVVHLHFAVRLDRDPGPVWSSSFREVAEFAAAERSAALRHRYVLVSSPDVGDALRRVAPDVDLTFAPLSLLPESYPPVPLDGPPVAGLIGTAGWAPTARAVEHVVHRLWPRVRAAVPEARLQLAGRGMASLEVLQQPHDGVDVVGEVDSARAFLAGLSLLLYPLTRGSGMKVKVLESMASGLPVVTTPRGAEGIAPGDGLTVSDDDDVLVAAAVELLSDPQARRERGAAVRAQFLAQHSPAVAASPVVDLYRRMQEG